IAQSRLISERTEISERADEGQVVDAQANVVAEVGRRHLSRIGAMDRLVDTLSAQLALVAKNRDALEEMAAAIAIEGGALGAEQRKRTMLAALSLGSHAATAEKLANTLRTLVNLE